MKEITNITPDGVHYVDENGSPQFTDFETCQQNNIENIKTSMGSRWTEEREEFYQRARYVARRHTWSEPPNIMFYTTPTIFFEFPTSDGVWKAASMIKRAGWRTNDGE